MFEGRVGDFEGIDSLLKAQLTSISFPGNFDTWSGRVLNSSWATGYLVSIVNGIAAFVFACHLVHLGNGPSLQSLLLAKKMSIAYGTMLGGALLLLPGAVAKQSSREIFTRGGDVVIVALFLTLSVLASRGVISPYKLGLAVVIVDSVVLGVLALGAGGIGCAWCCPRVLARRDEANK